MSHSRFIRVWNCPSCRAPQRDEVARTIEQVDADNAPKRCTQCGKLVDITLPSEIECLARKIGTPLPA